jgi:hypothetical protein
MSELTPSRKQLNHANQERQCFGKSLSEIIITGTIRVPVTTPFQVCRPILVGHITENA